MNLLKITGLTIILMLPVFIFIFLRTFGENVYTVPIYFGNGIPEDSVGCQKSDVPHRIPAFVLEDVNNRKITEKVLDNKYTIIDLYASSYLELNSNKEFQISRILRDAGSASDLQVLRICYDHDATATGDNIEFTNSIDNVHVIKAFGIKEDIFKLAHCGLVLLNFPLNASEIQIQNNTFVLVDQERRIRGYYNGTDFDETDRLMIELDIIVKEDKQV